MSLREQHEAAYLERQELRRGDSMADPRECCGHEARNHSPDGCQIPGCGCKWPKSSASARPLRLVVDLALPASEEDLRAALHALEDVARQKGVTLTAVTLVGDADRGADVWVEPVTLYGRRGKCAACGHEWELDSSDRGGGHFCPRP